MTANIELFELKMAEMHLLKAKLDGPKTRSKVEEGELVKSMFLSMVEFFPICLDTLKDMKTYDRKLDSLTEDLDDVKNDVEDLKIDMGTMKAELTTVINGLQSDNTFMKKQLIEMEIQNSQTAVIIRNFEPTNLAGKIGEEMETGADLRQGLDRFLSFLQINEMIKLKDAFRLRSRDKKKRTKFVFPCKAVFSFKK